MRRPTDPRIQVLRSAEIRKTLKSAFFTEHEVEIECHLPGVARYKSIELRPWSFDEFGPGDRRLLCLRFPGRMSGGKGGLDILEDMKHGFDSGLNDHEEFVVLASVFLRRRLKIGATTRMNDSPFRHDPRASIYAELKEDGKNLTLLPRFFTKVSKLQARDQHALLLASRFYHQGMALSDRDHELAYLAHVSAVEVLAHRMKLSHDPSEAIIETVWEAVQTIPDESARKLTVASLAETGRSTAWFVKLITTLTDDSFFRKDLPIPFTAITRDNLKAVASNVYRARSNALHMGQPFPSDLIWRTENREELGIGIPGRRGREIKGNYANLADPKKNKDRIPNLPAFERLVNHLLMRFVESGGASTHSARP